MTDLVKIIDGVIFYDGYPAAEISKELPATIRAKFEKYVLEADEENWQNGYDEGQEDGYRDGKEEGIDAGYDDGYDAGYEDAMKEKGE